MNKKILYLPILAILLLVLVGCSTTVMIDTNVEKANVKLNDRPIGSTPVTIDLSNAFWKEYYVDISKPGYKTVHAYLDKEPKIGPIIGGFFVGIPWLFSYGPEPNQYFYLEKIEN